MPGDRLGRMSTSRGGFKAHGFGQSFGHLGATGVSDTYEQDLHAIHKQTMPFRVSLHRLFSRDVAILELTRSIHADFSGFIFTSESTLEESKT